LFNKDNDFDCKLDDFEVINVIGKGSLSNVTHILYFRYIWFKRKKLRSSLWKYSVSMKWLKIILSRSKI